MISAAAVEDEESGPLLVFEPQEVAVVVQMMDMLVCRYVGW